MSRKFPCKHEMYEMAQHGEPDATLSLFQAYSCADFVWPTDPECFYCTQEPKVKPAGAALAQEQ